MWHPDDYPRCRNQHGDRSQLRRDLISRFRQGLGIQSVCGYEQGSSAGSFNLSDTLLSAFRTATDNGHCSTSGSQRGCHATAKYSGATEYDSRVTGQVEN